MVLLISPEQNELESCSFAWIEALEERNWLIYSDDAGLCQAEEKHSKSDQRWWWPFLPFFPNWCHVSANFANISRTNRARNMRLHSNWSSQRREKVVILRWCWGSVRKRAKCGKPDQWGWWSFLPFSFKLVPWFCLYLLNISSWKAALVIKLKLLKRGIGGYTQMMLGIR